MSVLTLWAKKSILSLLRVRVREAFWRGRTDDARIIGRHQDLKKALEDASQVFSPDRAVWKLAIPSELKG